jgi:hypothetical protein
MLPFLTMVELKVYYSDRQSLLGGAMSMRAGSEQVLGAALVTLLLLVPAALVPQASWAQVCMVIQLAFMAWLVLRKPNARFLTTIGRKWPSRFTGISHLNEAGIRLAQMLGIAVTAAALACAVVGWTTLSQFLLAVAIASALTNLLAGYCIGCDISDAAAGKRHARQS